MPEKLESTDSYIRCLTGFPHPLGNVVIARAQEREAFREMLAELELISQKKGFPIALLLCPDVTTDADAGLVEDRQWALLDKMPGMWMDIPEDFCTGPLAPGVAVKHADEEEELPVVTQLLAEGYPIPFEVSDFFMRGIHLQGEADGGNLANFIATVDGEPAACSSVCVNDGVAGVYCVATLEKFRGRGLGTAVTRAAVEHGCKQGAQFSLLHATEMGEPIYRKIGFVEKCRIPAYGFGLG